MQNQSKRKPRKTKTEEAVLVRALLHPGRLEMICDLLRKKAKTEAELVDRLDMPLALVNYHLKVLQSAGIVAYVDSPEPGSTDRCLVAAERW
jgi:DNA-binding transcriptional ArsR family regulator